MPGLESLIFSAALIVFLFTGAANLTIEQLITLVILFKKLKATVKSDYALESASLEKLALGEREGLSKVTPAAQTVARTHSAPGLEVNPPIVASVDSAAASHRVILPVMATIVEVEKLALDLSEKERATLAAKLLHTLPSVLADQHQGFAEALRRDAGNGADPSQAISLAPLDSDIQG